MKVTCHKCNTLVDIGDRWEKAQKKKKESIETPHDKLFSGTPLDEFFFCPKCKTMRRIEPVEGSDKDSAK